MRERQKGAIKARLVKNSRLGFRDIKSTSILDNFLSKSYTLGIMETLKLKKEEYDQIFTEKSEGKTIRVFVSYSSADRYFASEIKAYLENYSLSVFLAHEDIRPTVDWQNELVYNLRGCDIFMPILTSEFCNSEWTNQETGFAFALDKTILPLKINTNPSGFISRVQAFTCEERFIKFYCKKIINLIKEKPLFKESLKDCLIRSLEKAYNFDNANDKIAILKDFDTFSDDQANNLIRIFIKNNQVRMCTSGKEFALSILDKYDSVLNPVLKKIFGEIRENFYSPIIDEEK